MAAVRSEVTGAEYINGHFSSLVCFAVRHLCLTYGPLGDSSFPCPFTLLVFGIMDPDEFSSLSQGELGTLKLPRERGVGGVVVT